MYRDKFNGTPHVNPGKKLPKVYLRFDEAKMASIKLGKTTKNFTYEVIGVAGGYYLIKRSTKPVTSDYIKRK